MNTNSPLSVTNFAAYLKLIYVIRFNHSRNLILKSYFYKFKQLIADWQPEIKKIFKIIRKLTTKKSKKSEEEVK